MIPKDNYFNNLISTLCALKNPSSMQAFLTDVMTPSEIQEISARLQAAVMLKNGEKYISVTEATGLSSRTVARISEWLKKDTGGYSAAIATIQNHHTHL